MSRKRPSRGLFVALAVSAGWVGAAPVAEAQSAEAAVSRLEARFAEARVEAVHLLAPRAFGEAMDRLEDARRRAADGRDEAALREVGEAEARLATASGLADQARGLFAGALAARAAAIEAEAAERAPQAWRPAESELEEGGRRFERGDREEAAVRADRSVDLYRRAARAGRRDRLLGPAIAARQRAVSLGAEQLAPTAFGDGERALGDGEAGLDERTADGAAAAGARAREAFERAGEIAALADSVLRRQVPVERLVDAHDADLAALARAAGVGASAGDTEETTRRVRDEIARLQAENARLEGELADERADSERLRERLDDVEAERADIERRFAEVRDELLARREREERLLEASALFTPDEGEVFATADRLTLRLYGLTFESGSDEILEEHYPLLTKVQQVITAFDGARIRIEGHTDSQGRPESNAALSQSRAISVREHLLTRLPIPSSRFEAVGLGESRPIASNDDEEGRARNRRIEIMLTLPGG